MTSTSVREKFLDYNAAHQIEKPRQDAFRNELKYIRRMKPLSAPFRFLDAGCGPGLLTEFMIEQGVEGTGVDIDPSLVEAAKTRLERRRMRGNFLVARVEQLPCADGTFDLCVANSILEHAVDWKATLQEITRVLKPGGLLVFYTTNRLHPFQAEINNFPFYPWIPARLKKPILASIMTHRPDRVNYTDLPAIHWFTHEQLKAFLVPLGYRVATRLDLVERGDLTGWKVAAAPSLNVLRKVFVLRYLYYFYSKDVSVYAIKQSTA